MTRHQQWFRAGCVIEALLAGAGVVLNRLLGQPPLGDLHWSWPDVAIGLAATLPLLGVLVWLWRTRNRWILNIREFLEQQALPIFSRWSWWQLALISLLAGAGEELLFRAALQGGLTRLLGTGAGLVLASLLFGLAHLINWPYAVVAALIGGYLGGLWLWSGNLLAPIVTHAFYDFCALVYFVQRRRPPADGRG